MSKNGYSIEGAVWRIQELLDRTSYIRKQLKQSGYISVVYTALRFNHPLLWLRNWRQDHGRP